MKSRSIARRRFETAGWRTISLAHGQVVWPDGRKSRFNVRLSAKPGTDGDVELIAEDIGRSNGGCKTITLTRRL